MPEGKRSVKINFDYDKDRLRELHTELEHRRRLSVMRDHERQLFLCKIDYIDWANRMDDEENERALTEIAELEASIAESEAKNRDIEEATDA